MPFPEPPGRATTARPRPGIVSALFVLALVLLCLPASAQTGHLRNDPSRVLKKYLSLDYHGVRLEPLAHEALRPYVAWKEEPAWGRVVVVSGFTVPEALSDWEVLGNLDVIIPVEFTVLGAVYLESATFLHEPRVERVRFRVKAVRGLWRVVEPLLPPHVSQKRMVNYVRQALAEEPLPSRAAQLTALRDELKRAR